MLKIHKGDKKFWFWLMFCMRIFVNLSCLIYKDEFSFTKKSSLIGIELKDYGILILLLLTIQHALRFEVYIFTNVTILAPKQELQNSNKSIVLQTPFHAYHTL